MYSKTSKKLSFKRFKKFEKVSSIIVIKVKVDLVKYKHLDFSLIIFRKHLVDNY